MEDVPQLPGYSFRDYNLQDFKLNPKCSYLNGHRFIKDSWCGVGKRPIDVMSSAYSPENPEAVDYDPSLTYGRSKGYPKRQVIPHYVLFAQKCLNFKAFFRQSVYNSPSEHHRIRHVNIIYFLEDDTLCVIEPPVDNSGFQQGKLVRRGKIPKNQDNDVYHWKDLNVGINIEIYGVTYHTVDCDAFTREFLLSQGIDIGDKEDPPPDAYTQDRLSKLSITKTIKKNTNSNAEDSRRKFLEYDGMVLTFNSTWNDDYYQILYFLTDDTISIKESPIIKNGKDPCKLLLKKTKVPKNWNDLPDSYPRIYLERSDEEVVEYYSPSDFKIGETIFIFGRRFLLLDCDQFTRKYYCNMLGLEQPEKIQYNTENIKNGICQGIATNNKNNICNFKKSRNTNKEDVIRKLYNHQKKLRYKISMAAVHPDDIDREFIMEYSLGDGTIKINEIGKKNSGRIGGCFLSSMLVPKKNIKIDNCDEEIPIYYTPNDFLIGSNINIFNHHFLINDADEFVHHYVENNKDKFTPELVKNIQDYFTNKKYKIIQDNKNDNKIQDDNKITKNNIVIEPIVHPYPQGRLPKGKICSQCDDINNERRKITWSDQVQVPCTLTSG